MPLNIISYAYGKAANNSDTEKGPDVIEQSPFLKAYNLGIKWLIRLKSQDATRGYEAQKTVAQLNQALSERIRTLVETQQRFLTLGGDHSCAIGTWSGAASALPGPLGLIWIDAHLDSHTPESSLTQNIHGMPLATLLGYGDAALTHIQNAPPKILPENLVLIGIRSYEPAEQELLDKLGVRIFYMEDVHRMGLDTVMALAVTIITEKTAAFGISLDMDAIDPKDAPGVGYREANGIRPADLLKALKLPIQNKNFIGAEIAEFNPERDIDHKTEKLIIDLIALLC